MYNYSNEDDFVIDYKRNPKTGKLEVEFSNNRIFRNLRYSEENIGKLNQKLEEQAIAMAPKKTLYKVKSVFNGIGVALFGGVGTAVGLNLLELNNANIPIQAVVGASVLLAGASLVDGVKNVLKNKELEKYYYFLENRYLLESFSGYSNSLAGLSKTEATKLLSDENSFKTIKSLDDVSLKTMKTIISNIALEEEYGFSYHKSK